MYIRVLLFWEATTYGWLQKGSCGGYIAFRVSQHEGYIGIIYGYIAPIMENHIEKKMIPDTETKFVGI